MTISRCLEYLNAIYNAKKAAYNLYGNGFPVEELDVPEPEELWLLATEREPFGGIVLMQDEIIVAFPGYEIYKFDLRLFVEIGLVNSAYESVSSFASIKVSSLYPVLEKRLYEICDRFPNRRITFAGHSYGGAIATVCAYLYFSRNYKMGSVYTFGGLTVFSEEMFDKYNELKLPDETNLGDHTFNIGMSNDGILGYLNTHQISGKICSALNHLKKRLMVGTCITIEDPRIEPKHQLEEYIAVMRQDTLPKIAVYAGSEYFGLNFTAFRLMTTGPRLYRVAGPRIALTLLMLSCVTYALVSVPLSMLWISLSVGNLIFNIIH